MRHLAVIGLIGLYSGSVGLTTAHALAAPPKTAKPSPPMPSSDSVKKALESGDEARALQALDEIEQSNDRGAAPLVDALLVRGANSALLQRALAVDGALAVEASSAAIAPYVRHRLTEVRHAAAQSLIRTKGKLAVAALRDALRANDPALRGIAADGLGTLHATEAVSDLFVVLPKEVPEAAGAIGTLCSGDDCQRFLRFLGKLPFDVMQSGFLPILLRPGTDVPDSLKLQLIGKLQRMATPKSAEVLANALASYPPNGSPKVRAALDAAVHGHIPKGDES